MVTNTGVQSAYFTCPVSPMRASRLTGDWLRTGPARRHSAARPTIALMARLVARFGFAGEHVVVARDPMSCY